MMISTDILRMRNMSQHVSGNSGNSLVFNIAEIIDIEFYIEKTQIRRHNRRK